MPLQIITKKRYINRVIKITNYLNKEWGKKVAEEFVLLLEKKLILLSEKPGIGISTVYSNIKSVLVGKGFQNRLYYKVEKDKIVFINLFDIRRNPKSNPYNK